ncbi:MAG: hypothetical protein KC983_03985 [Phycisphaerales bacterium]|nr:hypothetical protein [Phycisphaerales bacterium]
MDVTIQPGCRAIADDLARHASADSSVQVFGHSLAEWRTKSRRELGLATDHPILATGHQALLWHPGILAKYLLVDAMTRDGRFAAANLVVDQHAGGYADLLLPIRRHDGALAERLVQLTTSPRDVPMAMHEPFTPPKPPRQLSPALPSITTGVEQICTAIYNHREAPNAALQMADALWDLMSRWVMPMPNITATDLMDTTFAQRMLQAMADDPWTCAERYNDAVRACPAAGIGTLLIRDDYVELPLWRIRPDGRRMHAYDNDVEAAIARPDDDAASLTSPLRLMPRALFMTALVRLVMCDVFVLGTGGATYDAAMEHWMRNWLGVEPAPIAVATATVRHPLPERDMTVDDVDARRRDVRRVWHNPERPPADTSIGPRKRAGLDRLATLPRNSSARRQAYFDLHRELDALRDEHADRVSAVQNTARDAERAVEGLRIAQRRSWAFPLYPTEKLDELARDVRARYASGVACP